MCTAALNYVSIGESKASYNFSYSTAGIEIMKDEVTAYVRVSSYTCIQGLLRNCWKTINLIINACNDVSNWIKTVLFAGLQMIFYVLI